MEDAEKMDKLATLAKEFLESKHTIPFPGGERWEEYVWMGVALSFYRELEQARKEAEWLAARCHEFCDAHNWCAQCCMEAGPYKRETCDCGAKIGYRFNKHTVENWRENARTAIKGGEVPKPYEETFYAKIERVQRDKAILAANVALDDQQDAKEDK